MALSKGSLLITNHRLSHRVINRCRPSSDGDIIVPNETVSILGTTSIRLEEVENFEVTPESGPPDPGILENDPRHQGYPVHPGLCRDSASLPIGREGG